MEPSSSASICVDPNEPIPSASTIPATPLTTIRLTAETADPWIVAWEAQAARGRSSRVAAYWPDGLGVDRRAPAAPTKALTHL